MCVRSVLEFEALDGRHIRIERVEPEIDIEVGRLVLGESGAYWVDGEEQDASGLAYRETDDGTFVITQTSEFQLSGVVGE